MPCSKAALKPCLISCIMYAMLKYFVSCLQARKALEEGPYRAGSLRIGSGRSSSDSRHDSPSAVLSPSAAATPAGLMQPGSPRETLPLKRPAPDAPSPTHSDSSIGPSIGDHISAALHGGSGGGASSAGAGDTADDAGSRLPAGARKPRQSLQRQADDDDEATSRHSPSMQAAAAASAVAAVGTDATVHALELARLRLSQDLAEQPGAFRRSSSGGRQPPLDSHSGNGGAEAAAASTDERQDEHEGVPHPEPNGKRSVRSLSDPLNSRMDRRGAAVAIAAHQHAAAAAAQEGVATSQLPRLQGSAALAAAQPAADVGSSLERLLQLQDVGIPVGGGAPNFLRRGLGLNLSSFPSAMQTGSDSPERQHPAAAAADVSAQNAAMQLRTAASAPEAAGVVPPPPPPFQRTSSKGDFAPAAAPAASPAAGKAAGPVAGSAQAAALPAPHSGGEAVAKNGVDAAAHQRQRALARYVYACVPTLKLACLFGSELHTIAHACAMASRFGCECILFAVGSCWGESGMRRRWTSWRACCSRAPPPPSCCACAATAWRRPATTSGCAASPVFCQPIWLCDHLMQLIVASGDTKARSEGSLL